MYDVYLRLNLCCIVTPLKLCNMQIYVTVPDWAWRPRFFLGIRRRTRHVSKVGVCHLLIWTGISVLPYMNCSDDDDYSKRDYLPHTWHHSRTEMMIMSFLSWCLTRLPQPKYAAFLSRRWRLGIYFKRSNDPRGYAVRVIGNVRTVFSPQMWRNTKSDISNQQRSVSLVATSGQIWYRLGAKIPDWIYFTINFILNFFFFVFCFFIFDLTFLRQNIAGIDGSCLAFQYIVLLIPPRGYPFFL